MTSPSREPSLRLRWRFFWETMPPIGARRKLIYVWRDVIAPPERSESPAGVRGEIRNPAAALRYLGFPPDWSYDEGELDAVTRRLALAAWGTPHWLARINEITVAREWLLRFEGRTCPEWEGWEEAEPVTIEIPYIPRNWRWRKLRWWEFRERRRRRKLMEEVRRPEWKPPW